MKKAGVSIPEDDDMPYNGSSTFDLEPLQTDDLEDTGEPKERKQRIFKAYTAPIIRNAKMAYEKQYP